MKSVSGVDYLIRGKIGSGSFGTVFRVHRKNGKIFAFKRFSRDQENDPGVMREISILTMFQETNENIVNISDIIITRDHFGIVLDHYRTDLYNALNTGFLKKSHKSRITYQLLKGLAFLKRNGVIHRDIKPENILMNSDFSVVIADFSLAKVFNGLSNHGTHTGIISTMTYRAPEVILKKPYSFPVDIWSLGVVLYEMYTNKPITKPTEKLTLEFLKKQVPKFNDNRLGNLIKNMLQISPEKRITPLQAIKDVFRSSYTPPIIQRPRKVQRVSREIRDWCMAMDIEKKITEYAAQTYYEKVLSCDPISAVTLASKIYETDPHTSDDMEYSTKEMNILRGMNFNLFI